jgi:hypothetical protein
MKSDNIYVHQHHDFGIGNFINCTPAIKIISEYINDKVQVVFDNKHVSQMFEKCDFMKIIDKSSIHNKKQILSSSEVNQNIEDWRYQCQLIQKRLNIRITNIPHTYVDSYNSNINNKYAVIIRGMINENWKERKDPGDEIYKHIINELIKREYTIVFVGSASDYNRNIKSMKVWADENEVVLDDVKQTLGIIKDASIVISNDTGMYHASGALNKETFVIWKDTPFIKNKSPSNRCFFSMKGNWQTDFDNWVYK